MKESYVIQRILAEKNFSDADTYSTGNTNSIYLSNYIYQSGSYNPKNMVYSHI